MQKAIKVVTGRRLYKHESPMEKRIVDEMSYYDGIGFDTQYKVGPFRLDVAVIPYKLGLEIDGRAYHSTPEQKARDAMRDKYLKSKGWTIERVPAWLCYQAPEMALLKMLRHYPDIEKWDRYQRAKTVSLQWLSRDLYQRGYEEESRRVGEDILK